jgi:autotransporter translocation and assembly factor TamB
MSIAGNWKLTLNSPLGAQQADLSLQEVEGAYQGTMSGSMGGAPTAVEELKADGDNVSFAADADTPVGRLRLAFNGTVTGDSIAGKYRIPFGEFDFTGTRA